MYSHEIDTVMKTYNYNIPSSVYLQISDVKYTTQIDHIKYDAWSGNFTIWTKDGWCWNFQVYYKE